MQHTICNFECSLFGVNLPFYYQDIETAAFYVQSVPGTGTNDFITTYTDTNTCLERFEERFVPVPMIDPFKHKEVKVERLKYFPSVRNVSRAFHLNFGSTLCSNLHHDICCTRIFKTLNMS